MTIQDRGPLSWETPSSPAHASQTHSSQAHAAQAHAAPLFDIAGPLLGAALANLARGRLVVELPSGQRVERTAPLDGPDALMRVHDWKALRRVATAGSLGFAEGYMEGEWTTPNLPALIELMAVNADQIGQTWFGSRLSRIMERVRHWARTNTKRGSRRNIAFHYDLGNDFYALWLDRGMQYSSAVFAEGDDLEAAQARKLDSIVERLALKGGEDVLEIGFGWGAVAERLARDHGARMVGLTLSERQLDYAAARLARNGLSADLRLQDYRDCRGAFDRIVSIEMIEAVGERYWPVYFATLRERLKAGGRAVIQAITIEECRYEDYRREPDFIQRYIFPGGMLPTPTIMQREVEGAGLKLIGHESFGLSYAKTLAAWRERFQAAWPQVAPLGFDEHFRRMWDYYLAYCEGGFRAGAIDVGLYTIARAD